MRIIYFSKMIEDEETREHCLKNCSLVIDGNNFLYKTYKNSNLPFVFGSEANEHARYLRSILKKFKDANVKCHFVFKGGDADMTTKLQNFKPLEYDIKTNQPFLPPIFLKEVCMQVLEEEKVNYATCIMESKDDCVTLANKLGCPVLSNNIEYCFKKAAYIPIPTLSYQRDSIRCRQYNIKDFLAKHSLTHKKFAIFAALSDTNVFPQNHFIQLFEKWSIIHTNLYIQNKNLLQWLSSKSEDEIEQNVSSFLSNKDEIDKFRNTFENILANMLNDRAGVVPDYLFNNQELDITPSDRLWFEKGVATQNIAILFINLWKHKLIQGSWAMDKEDSTGSSMFSIDIIKYAYNLLTDFQANDFSIFQTGNKFIKIDATNLNLRKPTYNSIGPVFQNGWEDIKRLRLFEHFLTENNINIDIINTVPPEARMLLIALTYFARKKASEGVDVTKHIYCFIVCHVILRVVCDKKGSLRKKSNGISEGDATDALHKTKNYFKLEMYEAMEIYNEDYFKLMVELQHCLAHMNYLNTLCGKSYKPTIYHRSFNGTFIYKLFYDLKDCHEDDFIKSLFKSSPTVYKCINKMITTYKKLI